jgi:DNA-binding MarR family transcriptional regulator
MSQRTDLTPEQTRVLAHLEGIFPEARSAADLAPPLDLPVPAVVAALRALRRRGDVRFGPGSPDGRPETEVYEATTKPR